MRVRYEDPGEPGSLSATSAGQDAIATGTASISRPRLDEQERRARTIGVRVTAAEAAELRERAQAARLSMGAYLRRRALGQRVRLAAELRLGAAELRELNRIGVNLNQMARALNSGAVSSPGLVLGHAVHPGGFRS